MSFGSRRVLVLDEDRVLASAVDRERHARARSASAAASFRLPAGPWTPTTKDPPYAGGYGLLVLQGPLVRHIEVWGKTGAEVVSAGDLIQPWSTDEPAIAGLVADPTWQVLEAARIAVLDESWARRMAAFPDVGASLLARSIERSERLLATLSIMHQRRLDARVWLLLWQLAERQGVRRPDGVLLPLRLTHELLGQLVGARRPSVSLALSRLARKGLVLRDQEGWILAGDPPEHVSSAGLAGPDPMGR